ncbi:MAG: N-acetyl-alpha-D-glucosaminyl L-malate synthase BshA [Acidobacteria bacterium]|nr:N-acetyl-alpha-D-glucosaminyl L-malate synthase BshA [Acidobacteriota bacterium]
MRIGISCYSTFGGSGVVATEVGKALAARGHEVHILSTAVPPRLLGFEDRVTFHEVTAAPYPLFESSPITVSLASKMADVAAHHGLEILHAHYALPHALSALLARMALGDGLKVVTTLHGTDITVVGADPSYLPMVRLAIRASDAVTAVSRFLKEETDRTFGVDRDIRVIPNFVEPPPGESSNCRSWLAPAGAKVLTHISNFRPVKRVMDVMQVFERVRREVDARLVMVGDGPDRAEAEGFARDRGLDPWVRFTGKQLDIGAVLACSDLFLLTSATESFGLAALEAMAYGVPVVASRVGGVPEVIRHGLDGFLEPMGDVGAMAARSVELLSDEPRRRAMGESARDRALGDFAEGPVVDMYESLYEDVLAPPRTTLDLGSSAR